MQTQNNDPTAFLLIFGLIGLGFLWHLVLVRSAKGIIREYLQSKGMTAISSTYEWPTFDRDTLTFSVDYRLPDGTPRQNHCKIHHWWLFMDDNIYWLEPI